MSEAGPGEKASPFLPERTRAVGLKFILVGALALLLWVPALFIFVLSFERSARADNVKAEIYQRQGGEQRIAGPFLIVPAIEEVEGYRKNSEDEVPIKRVRRTYLLLPNSLEADIEITTDKRQRSIYSAAVYESDVSLISVFDLSAIEKKPRTQLLWSEARLVLWLPSSQSLSGIRGEPELILNGKPQNATFRPDFGYTRSQSEDSQQMTGSGLSISLPLRESMQEISLSLNMTLSGGGSFGLALLGNETNLSIESDWPHPSFQGQLSPLTREISNDGFIAQWVTSSLSRSMPQSAMTDENIIYQLSQQMLIVGFVTPDSPYSKINRSLKYALLFMGLIFLTMFLLEILFNSQAHPTQYILVGMAQVLFYLMVLALSEHIAFDIAFLGMSVVTVLLSGIYAATVFQRRTGGAAAILAFSGVYGLIWLLMKSEDYALLIGASCAFTALAITMYVTRNIDWYGATKR